LNRIAQAQLGWQGAQRVASIYGKSSITESERLAAALKFTGAR